MYSKFAFIAQYLTMLAELGYKNIFNDLLIIVLFIYRTQSAN